MDKWGEPHPKGPKAKKADPKGETLDDRFEAHSNSMAMIPRSKIWVTCFGEHGSS